MSESLNVAHIHTDKGWGGGEYQLYHVISGMVKRNLPTLLVTPAGGKLHKKAKADGLPVKELPADDVKGLEQLLKSASFNMINAFDEDALAMGIKMKRRLNLPLLYTRTTAMPVKKSIFNRWKYTKKNITAMLAAAPCVKGELAKTRFPESDIFVVRSGVDKTGLDAVAADDAMRKKTGGAYIVGGLGRLTVKKNWAFLIMVATYMARTNGPQIQWVIAGEGPERQAFTQLIRRFKIGKIVKLAGYVNEAEKFLKSLDLMFFPSLCEATSVSLRHAMLLGVPIVALDNPVSVEMLAGHNWTVRAGAVQEAAKVITECLASKEQRDEKARLAKDYAWANFSMEPSIEGTLEVYRKVAAMR